MIPTLFNGMITLMLARFMVNAVPHALELLPPPTYNSIEMYPRVRRPPPTGTCYRDAWRYVMHHVEDQPVLVHGTIVGLYGRMNHAWVELPDGTVWDPSSQTKMPIEKYYSLVDPIVEDRYTADEAAHMLSVGKHGPWTDEERMKHIGR